MPNTYPDYPGHRFMYDVDGTIVQASPVSAVAPLSVQDALSINDEDGDGITWAGNYVFREITFAFPEVRNVTGLNVFHNGIVSWIITMWYSTDTTDGSDGTWTSYGNVPVQSTNFNPQPRQNIGTLAGITNVKGLKFRFAPQGNITAMVQAIHLYGDIPITANTDRVEFWDSVQDQKLDKMGLDFGDIVAGTSVTKQFRIKNLSTTKTANGVDIVRDNNGGPTVNDAMAAALQFSIDGGTTWSNSVSIASIAPGGYSAVIRARRTVAANELANMRFARVRAIPTSMVA